MLGTRTGSWTLAAAAPLCGLLLSALAAPAHATAFLAVYDTHTGTYLCNDSSAADAPLVCTGSIGSWSFTVDSGIDGSHDSVGKIDLAFDAIGSAPPSDQLYLAYYIDDLTGTGTENFWTKLGGTADSGITGNFLSGFFSPDITSGSLATFCGQTGPDFGPATVLSTFCNQTGPFSDSQYLSGYPINGTYQLGLIADLNLNSGKNGIVSGDFEVETVPEPSTLALFGVGLLGCVLVLRRRRVPNA